MILYVIVKLFFKDLPAKLTLLILQGHSFTYQIVLTRTKLRQ